MSKRNWSKYNKQLVKRGSITFLFDEKFFKKISKPKKNKRGRPVLYPLELIQVILLCKIHFRLPYRAAEGFTKSVFPKFGCFLPLPTSSLLQKRMKEVTLPKMPKALSMVIMIDASGMKIFGEGEWKRKVHGMGKRRKWKKLHIAVDLDSGNIVAGKLTNSNVHDSKVLGSLLDACEKKNATILADGAYDSCRAEIEKRKMNALIPPPRNGRYKNNGSSRDKSIAQIAKFGNDEIARSLWGKLTGYSKRALVETVFSRLKRIYGGGLFSRKQVNQNVEASLKCFLLNKMNKIAASFKMILGQSYSYF